MAGCPNCGRRTQRTKDWVCEWCGYPLLYGSYKMIEKTFKELQEERNPSGRALPPEPELEEELTSEPEPEPEPEPKRPSLWKLRKPPRPESRPEPPPEPEPELEYKTGPEPRPAAQPRPQPTPTPLKELLPGNMPQPALLPEAEKSPEPEPRLPPRPSTPPRAEEPPPPMPEPKEEPEKIPDLGSIKDGTQLTIDQIDALFRADNVGTNAALKNKTLIIKGIVNKVFIRDHLDIRYMILTGARKGIWSARCQFEKESEGPISRLSEGQAVALRGKYDGYSKNIIFKDCQLVAAGS